MDAQRPVIASAESLAEIQRAEYRRKREQADEIIRIVKLLVPGFILKMNMTKDSVPKGVAVETLRLGLACGTGMEPHGIWRAGIVTSKPIAEEWSQAVDTKNNKFIITQGPVMWSNVCVNTATPMTALADQDVSYAGVANGEVRYLYIEITLSTSPSTSNATVILGDNGYYPIDEPENMIVRIPLSKWSFEVDGATIIPTELKPRAWSGGNIKIVPASVGPP